jgi:glutamine amidotransferase-like uncharacterized protein
MKAAYLWGHNLATHSISLMLHDQFGKRNVTQIPAEDLKDADLSRFDLLLLPGSVGETSPYPQILTPEVAPKLFNEAVYNNGLMLWTDCSATYEMTRIIQFTSSKGELITRNGLGIYDADSLGPYSGQAIAPSLTERFQDVVIKRIFYNSTQRKNCEADICYGNGPAIYLSDKELRNPDVNVIARYGTTENSPVAAMTKKFGKGLLISLGVLVQISPDHMMGTPSDERAAKHRRALFNHLSEADHLRQHFLGTLMHHVHTHYNSLKTARTATPSVQERHVHHT